MFLNYDLRYSLRTLRRTPGFALAAIAILALTIGANTAIFSVVHAIVLRPLPYLHPDELVELAERNAAGERVSVAYPNFENWRDETQGLVHMAAFVGASYNVSNVDGTPEPILGMRVGPEFLGILGIVPAMGRDFVVQDGRGDGEHVMLLTDSLWRRRFGADPQVVGKPVTMGFIPYTVVGVVSLLAGYRGAGAPRHEQRRSRQPWGDVCGRPPRTGRDDRARAHAATNDSPAAGHRVSGVEFGPQCQRASAP